MPSAVRTLSIVVAAATWSVAAMAQPAPSELRGWSIAYADGRTAVTVLRHKGGMWTHLFPRVDTRAIAPTGAAKYLDIRTDVDGTAVVATITLVTDGFRDRVPVAIVRVTPEQPVVVDQLAAFGVRPVTLSIVPIDPIVAYPAPVTEPSGQLVARLEPEAPNQPMYRFTLVNTSARPLQAIRFVMYQGDKQVLSGVQAAKRNEPLIEPGGEYSFRLPVSRSPATGLWHSIDRAVITTVMWEDGGVDGDPTPAVQRQARLRTREAHLRRLLEALRAAGVSDVQTLRAAFLALERADPELESVRAEGLTNLDVFERSGDADARQKWVTARIAEYAPWHARVARLVK